MQSDAESTGNDRVLSEDFLAAVADLAEGELTFPPPFDLATAAALGENMDKGELALKLFEATASRDTGYRVLIEALTPEGSQPMRREIINTTVPSTMLLFALLDGLLDEIEARRDDDTTD